MATKPLISDYLVPPGLYVREALEHYGMTQAELAERTGRPTQAISEIVNAKKEITKETAFELEAVLGTPAHVWLNLECTYRYGLEAKHHAARLAEQVAQSENYPYSELAKLGWVTASRNKSERVGYLLSYFGVAHLDLVKTNYSAAFRKSVKKEPSPYCLAAWLRIGERLAEKIDLPPYDKEALKRALPELRRATRTSTDVVLALQIILHYAGVAFVIAPHLTKTYANGAVFWHGSRPVILMSIRGAYEDVFWFTLFHELGHILLHEKSATFIEGLGMQSDEEKEADEFACNTLIPQEIWLQFRQNRKYDMRSVENFSRDQEISPAIVVGRLMHDDSAFDGYHTLRRLRRQLTFVPTHPKS